MIYALCPMTYVLFPISYALCPMSYGLWHMLYELYPMSMSYVPCLMPYVRFGRSNTYQLLLQPSEFLRNKQTFRELSEGGKNGKDLELLVK